jgi:hypothetical protein
VLWRIFGRENDGVSGKWRKLHNEELNDLHNLANIIRVIISIYMLLVGNVARVMERRGTYKVLVRKIEGKRPIGKPSRRWKDNIKKDLQVVECKEMDYIELAQGKDK